MKRVVLGIVATLIALPMIAQNLPSRVAVINVQKVLADSTRGKAEFDRLRQMQKDRETRLKQLQDELNELKGRFSPSLSDEKKAELQKQISDKQLSAQRFAQDAEREMKEETDRALQALEREILPIINEVGKEMGFAAIFNKFESGLVYASEAIDITDVIVKRYNEKVSSSQ